MPNIICTNCGTENEDTTPSPYCLKCGRELNFENAAQPETRIRAGIVGDRTAFKEGVPARVQQGRTASGLAHELAHFDEIAKRARWRAALVLGFIGCWNLFAGVASLMWPEMP